ncbi:hypothetical protein CKK33_15340 [Mucilaginibacter sp. MD40]|uniref:AraC family transcriptional regulator n=1 Tax=Mucilaginibacter sp. MD40 TaxID=2029590 RepID=UPI000BAC59DF|nr:AraC family transcriptional regulator [Mucilaginibacter sp. MD40]PAW94793.1 hypothetical protein CKK33_15340 [Mucilaginibacter sp. MD40]
MRQFLHTLTVSYESVIEGRPLMPLQGCTSLHYHNELEILLILEGSGECFIGNYAGTFEPGDIFMIGSGVAHAFEGLSENKTKATSIGFRSDFLGKEFIDLPEFHKIRSLFERAKSGLKFKNKLNTELGNRVNELEEQANINRIISLCNCLDMIASEEDYQTLSTLDTINLNSKVHHKLNKILEYTANNFNRVITLQEIAEYANMSIPSFCDHFKRYVNKTFIEFLNEFRLSYACKLLIESELSICDIYLRCGYNTPANFNKQFLKYKEMSPTQYRKKFNTLYKLKNSISDAA